MRGVLLAGGSGTRLHPITQIISKHLLPVYDKPMIYYPLTTLMLAGIQEIMIISTPHDQSRFEQLLGDGGELGLALRYAVQEEPRGIADALLIAADFIGEDRSVLILGDNIFYGSALRALMQHAVDQQRGATIFAYPVSNPTDYGVVEFDAGGKPAALIEKPLATESRYAVTGLYFYDNQVVDIAQQLSPSKRNELEITDVNRVYMQRDELEVMRMGRGMAWLDTGTAESLLEASHYVHTIEKRQGLKVACPEEIAFRMHYISREELSRLARGLQNSGYGKYLLDLAEGYLA